MRPRFHLKTLLHALIITIALTTAVTMSAHQGGQIGASQGGCGGFGCHGGNSNATTVALNGPREASPGQIVNYTFTVAHATHNYSGFNASIMGAFGAAGTLAPGANTQLMGGELTHTNPTADGAGGTAEFNFTWTAPNDPGTYTFYGAGNAVNNNGGADGADVSNTTGGITITVKGVNLTSPSGGTYCRGASVTISWTQVGYTTFKIEASSNNFSSSDVITNSVAATANTYTWTIPAGQEPSSNYQVRIVNTADGQELKRSNAFAIKGAPTITTQPQSATVCEGRTIQLFVASDNGSATYQWKKGGNVIPGATTAAYQVAVAKPEDAGSYEAVVFGCGGSATSNPAVITIGMKPKITVQPLAKTVCENDSISLFADGEAENAVYQWYKNGAALPGKNSKTLKFSTALLSDEGAYSLHVLGACQPDAVSNEVQLNVVEKPKITVQPTDKNLKVGDTLTLVVDGFGEGVSYQWRKDGNEIPGATQKTYRKTAITRSDSGSYEVLVKNQCDTLTSRKSLVKVVPSDGPGIPELNAASLELGTIPMCAQIDTTLTGLLRNAGGTALNVTSISADPPTLLMVQDFTTPQSIAVGGASDLHLIVTPTALGAISGTVTFFTANGNAVFEIHGTATTGITASLDTMLFLEGATDFERCVTLTLDPRCTSATLTQATLQGVGAGSYSVQGTWPMTITPAAPVQLCLRTTAGTGGDASVVIETSAGSRTLELRRRVFSSVEDITAESVSIQPNPASDGVSIKGLPQGAAVRILSLQGVEVANVGAASLAGASDLNWNGRDASGASVASGTYVVLVSTGNHTFAYTLVIAR